MGTYTNKNSYPEWLCNMLQYNPYTTGPKKSDISVTQLIDSPQILALRKEHRDKISEDVSDRVWAVWGSAVHSVCELANLSNSKTLVEKRFHHTYSDRVISGQVDIYDLEDSGIYDIKTVSAYALMHGVKPVWEQQLNVLANLMSESGWSVKRLFIVAFAKDWSQKSASNSDNYPQHPLTIIPIELWGKQAQQDYIEQRLQRHFWDDKICNKEEKWQSEDKTAVMKKGKVRAVKLFDTKDDANDFIIMQKDQEKLFLEDRPGYSMRCKMYCNVKQFCPQYAKENSKK